MITRIQKNVFYKWTASVRNELYKCVGNALHKSNNQKSLWLSSPSPKDEHNDERQDHAGIFYPIINTVPPLNQPQYKIWEPHRVEDIQCFPLCFLYQDKVFQPKIYSSMHHYTVAIALRNNLILALGLPILTQIYQINIQLKNKWCRIIKNPPEFACSISKMTN